jgi:hypothetical protein
MNSELPGLIKPTVHLNGTSGDDLLEQLTDANVSICEALTDLCDAAPNARDYYPQGDTAFRAARSQHDFRVARLISVREEIQALAHHVADQIREGKRHG